jgi:hypothetical protein
MSRIEAGSADPGLSAPATPLPMIAQSGVSKKMKLRRCERKFAIARSNAGVARSNGGIIDW